MTRALTPILLAAAALLAGCSDQGNAGESAANEVANAAPIELPPSIAASKIYRCKDNSVVYVDWMSDNKSVNFRTDRNGLPIQLKAPEPGQPMVAEGYALTGDSAASSINVARPGAGTITCHT